MWLSVPPLTIRSPRLASSAASTAAFATIAPLDLAERRPSPRSRSTPPWPRSARSRARPGCPGRSRGRSAFASSARDRITPPCGPSIVLYVVNVTASACGTGLGSTPPATRPATWAMSTRSRASTSRGDRAERGVVDRPGVRAATRDDQPRAVPACEVANLVQVDRLGVGADAVVLEAVDGAGDRCPDRRATGGHRGRAAARAPCHRASGARGTRRGSR